MEAATIRKLEVEMKYAANAFYILKLGSSDNNLTLEGVAKYELGQSLRLAIVLLENDRKFADEHLLH